MKPMLNCWRLKPCVNITGQVNICQSDWRGGTCADEQPLYLYLYFWYLYFFICICIFLFVFVFVFFVFVFVLFFLFVFVFVFLFLFLFVFVFAFVCIFCICIYICQSDWRGGPAQMSSLRFGEISRRGFWKISITLKYQISICGTCASGLFGSLSRFLLSSKGRNSDFLQKH